MPEGDARAASPSLLARVPSRAAGCRSVFSRWFRAGMAGDAASHSM